MQTVLTHVAAHHRAQCDAIPRSAEAPISPTQRQSATVSRSSYGVSCWRPLSRCGSDASSFMPALDEAVSGPSTDWLLLETVKQLRAHPRSFFQ